MSDEPGAPGTVRRAGNGGGAAVQSSSVRSTDVDLFGVVRLVTRATGGAGGNLSSDSFDALSNNVGMMAGDGGDVDLFNAVSGSGKETVRLQQLAIGGTGGNSGNGGQAGSGGTAASRFSDTVNHSDSYIDLIAIGGNAGTSNSQDLEILPVVSGGRAQVSGAVHNDGGSLHLTGTSTGGAGSWVWGYDYGMGLDRLGGKGGNASTDLFGQTSQQYGSLYVEANAQGGTAACYKISMVVFAVVTLVMLPPRPPVKRLAKILFLS